MYAFCCVARPGAGRAVVRYDGLVDGTRELMRRDLDFWPGRRAPARGGRGAMRRRRFHRRASCRRRVVAPYWSPGHRLACGTVEGPAGQCRDKLGGGGRKRAVIGWSMGAYGALVAAETEPDLFAAVVAVSPRVDQLRRDDARAAGRVRRRGRLRGVDVIAHADRLSGVNLRIDCGKQDPFYGYVTYLTAALRNPPRAVQQGGHDHEYAARVAPPRRVHRAGASLALCAIASDGDRVPDPRTAGRRVSHTERMRRFGE